jgi:hypothetical protein
MRITRSWAELSTGDPVPREIADDIVWPFSQLPLEPSENQKMERVVCEEGTARLFVLPLFQDNRFHFLAAADCLPAPSKMFAPSSSIVSILLSRFKTPFRLCFNHPLSLRMKCQTNSI